MDLPEYGCTENVETKDNDSDISEKCFHENHRGDSRKWLIRDGQMHDRHIKSTMKTTYPYPYQEERQYIGQRKLKLMKQLYEEAEAEIIKELNEPSSVEEYCTEYDGNFNSNVKIIKCDIEEDMKKELYNKYPLYTSPAASFWNFKIEKDQKSNINIPGLTKPIDVKNPFKRHSEFTKPISEVLDDYML